MICNVCRRGATLNGQWRAKKDLDPLPGYVKHILLLADEAHSLCRGCTCQHATGEASLVVTPE